MCASDKRKQGWCPTLPTVPRICWVFYAFRRGIIPVGFVGCFPNPNRWDGGYVVSEQKDGVWCGASQQQRESDRSPTAVEGRQGVRIPILNDESNN